MVGDPPDSFIDSCTKITVTLSPPDRSSVSRSVSRATASGDRPLWYGAMAEPATPFSAQSLPVAEGKIPEDLAGTLYRNGPGQLGRDGVRVGHWFDGDGAVLAVRFGGGAATATYQYVDTAGRREEEAAGRWLYGNYGMLAAGNWWQRLTEGRSLKNAANTSVLPLPDRLLALWEGGRPHRLDLETLATVGLEDFRSDEFAGLPSDRSYSAHPKIDPVTGEIYNFGMVPGPINQLWLYRSDRTGKLIKQNCFKLPRLSLTHDFALAGPYLIFCLPPVQLQLLPALLNLKSFSESLEWRPEAGTRILVFDRETLELVSRATVEPWFQWHFSHGWCDRDGKVHVGLVGYEDFATNQHLQEIATGDVKTPAAGTLREIIFDPQNPEQLDHKTLVNRHCEFPVINPHGNLSTDGPQDIYLSIHHQDLTNPEQFKSELFGAIAHYQTSTDQLTIIDTGTNYYPSEPAVIFDENNQPKYLLTVVYDGDNHCSQVWIFDGRSPEHLQAGAIAKLQLSSVIPHSFHGVWHSGVRHSKG